MLKNLHSQYVYKPTHSPGNNTLYLVCTNDNNLINDILITPTIFSDHHMIKITTNITIENEPQQQVSPNPTTTPLKKFNFHSDKTNWDNINSCLVNQPWESIFQNLEIKDKIKLLLEKCNEASLSNAPLQLSTLINRMPRDRKMLFRKLRNARKRLSTHTNENTKHNVNNKIVDIETALLKSRDDEQNKNEAQAVQNIEKKKNIFISLLITIPK